MCHDWRITLYLVWLSCCSHARKMRQGDLTLWPTAQWTLTLRDTERLSSDWPVSGGHQTETDTHKKRDEYFCGCYFGPKVVQDPDRQAQTKTVSSFFLPSPRPFVLVEKFPLFTENLQQTPARIGGANFSRLCMPSRLSRCMSRGYHFWQKKRLNAQTVHFNYIWSLSQYHLKNTC